MVLDQVKDSRRGAAWIVSVMLLLCAAVSGAAAGKVEGSPGRAELVTRSYANDAGSRTYQVYTPRADMRGRPLVVWLHGTSEVANGDSRVLQRSNSLVREAGRRGYSVVAPNQSLAAHPQGAWNIFDPKTMMRGRGEVSIVAGIIRREIRALGADPRRVYVAGHSAGAAMTNYLAALYPELVTATSVSAGWPYLGDPTGLAVRTAMGPRRRAMPTFITQGTDDTLSVPIFGAAIRNAMLHVNGLGSRDIVSANRIAPGPDRHAVDLTTYGRHGRAVVVYANVLGGDGRVTRACCLSHHVADEVCGAHPVKQEPAIHLHDWAQDCETC